MAPPRYLLNHSSASHQFDDDAADCVAGVDVVATSAIDGWHFESSPSLYANPPMDDCRTCDCNIEWDDGPPNVGTRHHPGIDDSAADGSSIAMPMVGRRDMANWRHCVFESTTGNYSMKPWLILNQFCLFFR